MVNYNGALVWVPRLGEVILHRPIPVAAAMKIITVARQKYPGIRVSGEIGDKWYTDFYDGKYQTETAKLRNPDMVAPIEQWLTKSVTKLLLLGKTEWLSDVNRYVREKMAGYVRSVQTDDYLLQIMNSSASKLEALKSVSRRLGVPREQIMAIGDNNNDVGMVQWAGFGVCMENGSEMCLKHADFVTDSNENDGVARAIREFVLGGTVSDGIDEVQ
jgi:Cof subfamily protein (haloacid dehalogenase superfamily)